MKTISKSFNPIKNPSLYTLTNELYDALSAVDVDPETGEITGMDKVDALALDTQEKIVACLHAVKDFEALADEIRAEKKRLDERLDFTQHLIYRVKSRCVFGMQVLGLQSIKAASAQIHLRKIESVEVFDEGMIDPRFVKTREVKTVNKTEIKKAIKAGEEVQGARLVEGFAAIIR